MSEKIKDEILHDHNNDGVNRRSFLKCMGIRDVNCVQGQHALAVVDSTLA